MAAWRIISNDINRMISPPAFRKALLHWYNRQKRDLPWRRTLDPYRIWISEIMLQQTRVAAVIPYFERFLERFPTPAALAAAPQADVLAAWAGLGYYSRARNLQAAARQMNGAFPSDYESIRALPGIGDYTAAAVGSIAFGLPHAAVDGNVLRVLSRVANDASDIASPKTRARFQQLAGDLLDRRRPGDFNQAMMELGATLCLPRQPQCLLCPVAALCRGLQAGRQNELPVKSPKAAPTVIDRTILIVERTGKLLMWQRPSEQRKLGGFWEFPEADHFPDLKLGKPVGVFRHSIMNHNYRITVCPGELRTIPSGFEWIAVSEWQRLPVSTTAKKAWKTFSCSIKPSQPVTR